MNKEAHQMASFKSMILDARDPTFKGLMVFSTERSRRNFLYEYGKTLTDLGWKFIVPRCTFRWPGGATIECTVVNRENSFKLHGIIINEWSTDDYLEPEIEELLNSRVRKR